MLKKSRLSHGMTARLAIAAASVLLTAWGTREPEWPYSGPMPDEPVPVAASRYAPVGVGTKSYRPVEPMPWGGVNERVAPAEQAPRPQDQQQESPKPQMQEHGNH